MGPDRRQLEQVVEPQHPQVAGALQQDVQQVTGGEGVGQSPVRRPVRQPQPLRQRSQLAVRHLVADQPPGQGAGVDPPVGQGGAPRQGQRRLQEPQVEPDVVPDNDRGPDELEERRQYRLYPGSREHHGLGDAGQDRDLGRYPDAGIDQRLERAEALAAPQLDRPDLGDGVTGGRGAGGFEVEHAEGDLVEWHAQVVEAPLH